MSDSVEKILKDGLDAEKEAMAISEAISFLVHRHGEDDRLISEMSDDLTFMHEKAKRIEDAIERITKEDIKKIFTYRYIKKMNWDAVAEACHISLAHVHRLHKEGLQWLQNIEN